MSREVKPKVVCKKSEVYIHVCPKSWYIESDRARSHGAITHTHLTLNINKPKELQMDSKATNKDAAAKMSENETAACCGSISPPALLKYTLSYWSRHNEAFLISPRALEDGSVTLWRGFIKERGQRSSSLEALKPWARVTLSGLACSILNSGGSQRAISSRATGAQGYLKVWSPRLALGSGRTMQPDCWAEQRRAQRSIFIFTGSWYEVFSNSAVWFLLVFETFRSFSHPFHDVTWFLRQS